MQAIETSTRAKDHRSGLSTLSIELQMLLRTMAEQQRPMSAYELTNHWAPTWSLHEVEKFMRQLVHLGWVQANGQWSKVYSIVGPISETGSKS